MVTLRSAGVVEAALLALLVVGAVVPGRSVETTSTERFKDAVALPGTGLAAMSPKQSAWMACRVSELLTGSARDHSRLEAFTSALRRTRQVGIVRMRRVCAGGRTVEQVCRQIGALMLRQQALERTGNKVKVAAFLTRVGRSRKSGVPEEKVQEMVREALKNGELAPGADRECQLIQKQLDDLTRQLVETEQVLAGGELRPFVPVDRQPAGEGTDPAGMMLSVR